MKQMKTKGLRHSTRLTEKSYNYVHRLAILRKQSDTLTLEQIIEDYLKGNNHSTALPTAKNLKV